MLEESLITAVYDKNIIKATFFFFKEVLGAGKARKDRRFFCCPLLILTGIGCRSTSKLAAQSHSQGINQSKRLFMF